MQFWARCRHLVGACGTHLSLLSAPWSPTSSLEFSTFGWPRGRTYLAGPKKPLCSLFDLSLALRISHPQCYGFVLRFPVALRACREVSRLKDLKRHLQRRCGIPRFQMRLWHHSKTLSDEVIVPAPTDLQLLVPLYSPASDWQVSVLVAAAESGNVAQSGFCFAGSMGQT